jgi:ribosomal-protein-alanine N-acetyltransferase
MERDDLEAVMALAEGLVEAPHWPRKVYEAALDRKALRERMGLVAEDARGRLGGFAIASLTGGEAELESIAVTLEWQRRGVARALFEELAGRLRGRGVGKIFLEVRESNSGAREFYRAVGFAEAGRRRAYYAEPPEDAVVMRMEPVHAEEVKE